VFEFATSAFLHQQRYEIADLAGLEPGVLAVIALASPLLKAPTYARTAVIGSSELVTTGDTRCSATSGAAFLGQRPHHCQPAATVLCRHRNDRCQRVFNILRDWYNNRAGRDDPKAKDKLEHGEK
jgi:hypothetical protein